MLTGQVQLGYVLIIFGFLLFLWGIQIDGMRLWQTWWRGRPVPFDVTARVLDFDYQKGAVLAGIPWQKGFSHVLIDIRSVSAKTIENLDLLFGPERPIIYSSAISEFADCRIAPLITEPQITVVYNGADGGKVAEPIDSSQPGNYLIGPYHRLRCDSLPSGAKIRVNLATVRVAEPPIDGRLWDEIRCDPKTILIVINWSENGWDYEARQELGLSGDVNA